MSVRVRVCHVFAPAPAHACVPVCVRVYCVHIPLACMSPYVCACACAVSHVCLLLCILLCSHGSALLLSFLLPIPSRFHVLFISLSLLHLASAWVSHARSLCVSDRVSPRSHPAARDARSVARLLTGRWRRVQQWGRRPDDDELHRQPQHGRGTFALASAWSRSSRRLPLLSFHSPSAPSLSSRASRVSLSLPVQHTPSCDPRSGVVWCVQCGPRLCGIGVCGCCAA